MGRDRDKVGTVVVRPYGDEIDGKRGSSGLGGPKDVELFSDVGEILVAGGERGFAMDSEGGGETIGIGQPMLGAGLFRMQLGGAARQFEVGVHDFQRELGDVLKNFARDPGSLGAPGGVIHFAPIHHGHQQLAFAFDAQANQLLDLFRAGGAEFMEVRPGRRSVQAVSLSSIDAVREARHSKRKSERGYPAWRSAPFASMTLLPRFS